MKRDFIKKIICCTAITTSMVTVLPLNVYATTWLNDSMGNYYFYESNSYAVGWRNIDGIVYYFDASGVMQKGWIQYGDSWYYLDDNGALKTGWINYNGEWYYSDSAGIMQTGTLQIDGQTYCFGNNGAMKKGSVIINGQFYTIGANGAIISNTVPVPDKIFDSANNCIQQINSIDTSKIIDPNGSKYNNPIEDQSEIGDYEEPKQKFTVTFRDENGEELKTKKVKDGDTVKMYEPDDENAENSDDEREFVEWNTKRDGSGKSYDDDDKVKVTKDLTLYAIWEEVEEKTEVSSISISGDSEVEIGKTIQLTADVSPSNATNTKVKWSIESSTGEGVGSATIDSNGVLKGVSLGKVIVKAEAADGSKASTTKEFKVVDAKTLVTGIIIKADDNKITADGGTLKITADISPEGLDSNSIKWNIIEGSNYASISDDGILKAISNGKVKVQAVARDGSGVSSNELEIEISGQTVKAAKIIVSGENNKKKVSAGGTLIMEAKVLPNDVSSSNMDVEWKAEYADGSTADIEPMDGNKAELKAKLNKKGKIQVTATSKSDSSIVGKTTIIAVKDVEDISITSTDTSGNPKNEITKSLEKLLLKATFINEDGIDNETDTNSIIWGIEDITNGSTVTTGSAVTATSCDKASITTSAKTATITGLKNGTVRVYAMANDATKKTVYKDIVISGQITKASELNLNVEATTGSAVVIENKQADIKKGDVITITATIDDKATNKEVNWDIKGNTDSISWETASDNKNKIVIKADKPLTRENSVVNVKAIADNLVKECIININDVVNDMILTTSDSKVLEGQTINISAELRPAYMSGKEVTWSVVEGSTGRLSPDGAPVSRDNVSTQTFTATQAGNVKVKAECSSGYSKETYDIKVLPKMQSIKVQLKNPSDSPVLILGKNEDDSTKVLDLKAVVTNAESGDLIDANSTGDYDKFIKWSVDGNYSNSKVSASIDDNGRLTVTRKGEEEIPGDYSVTVKAESKYGDVEEVQTINIMLKNKPEPESSESGTVPSGN